eukprot:CAMPEP_0206321522 /NCGR_PEP_ID=MMETSP0106_2-20121207/18926_1 /ASSEMBLY_ACC=CAM_ASM_000206 /TAXON_ID=81532 /ORGANISM="Acanthoeca-like sp., Strain 10tr" /LENGTH=1030 /DNA_ID=CAMNT_0053753611 /DNA_START=144 /DNA_END=3236 /DNA_ORIENTATION=-
MSTSATVWRGTLQDWVTDALGHGRADEADGIVNALCAAGLGSMSALHSANVSDLMMVGCPGDVAQAVLSALDYDNDDQDAAGYYEIAKDLVPHPHPVPHPEVANSFEHRAVATHDKKAFGASTKKSLTRTATSAEKHPELTAEYWEVGIDTLPTGPMRQEYRATKPGVDKKAFGPSGRMRSTTGPAALQARQRRRKASERMAASPTRRSVTASASKGKMRQSPVGGGAPPAAPSVANGRSQNGAPSAARDKTTAKPKPRRSSTRSTTTTRAKSKPYSEMATKSKPRPSPERSGGWDSTTTDQSRYRRSEVQARRRFQNFNTGLTAAHRRSSSATRRRQDGRDDDAVTDDGSDYGANETMWSTSTSAPAEGLDGNDRLPTKSSSSTPISHLERLATRSRRERREEVVRWATMLQRGHPATTPQEIAGAAAHLMEAARLPDSRGDMIQAGVLPRLLALIQSGDESMVPPAAGCAANLADGGKEIRLSMLELGFVEALNEAMVTDDHDVLEKCIGALRNLTVASDRIRDAVVRAGIPDKLVTALSFDDTAVQEEAAATLKNLMGGGGKTTAALSATDAPRELSRLLLSDFPSVRDEAEKALLRMASGSVTEGEAPCIAHPVVRAVLDVISDAKHAAIRPRDEYRAVGEDSAALESQVSDLKGEISSITAVMTAANAEVATLAERCASIEKENYELRAENASVLDALKEVTQELSNIRVERDRLVDSSALAAGKLALREEEIETLRQAVKNLEMKNADMQGKLAVQGRRSSSSRGSTTRRTPTRRSMSSPAPAFGSATPRDLGDLTKERLVESQQAAREKLTNLRDGKLSVSPPPSRISNTTVVLEPSPDRLDPAHGLITSNGDNSPPVGPKILEGRERAAGSADALNSSHLTYRTPDFSHLQAKFRNEISQIQFDFGEDDSAVGDERDQRQPSDNSLSSMGNGHHGGSAFDSLYPMRTSLGGAPAQETGQSSSGGFSPREAMLRERAGTFTLSQTSLPRHIAVTVTDSPATPGPSDATYRATLAGHGDRPTYG